MKPINILSLLLLLIVSISSSPVFSKEPWTALFDGKTLEGWEQKV